MHDHYGVLLLYQSHMPVKIQLINTYNYSVKSIALPSS